MGFIHFEGFCRHVTFCPHHLTCPCIISYSLEIECLVLSRG